MDSSTNSPLSKEGEVLLELILDSFSRVSVRQWGYFYPLLIATWRFIWYVRPGILGEVVDIRYVFGSPPQFKGRNADWFAEMLVDTRTWWNLCGTRWLKVSHPQSEIAR
jgi:hypothetical protein